MQPLQTRYKKSGKKQSRSVDGFFERFIVEKLIFYVECSSFMFNHTWIIVTNSGLQQKDQNLTKSRI